MTPRQAIAAALCAAFSTAALPQDMRCAHEGPAAVPRAPSGKIARSTAARAAFIRLHPCPTTRQVSGACDGWEVDHVIPLAVGGADEPVNMQWLPSSIKRRHAQAKDRWERTVYSCKEHIR
jgi:hypothetical protein